MLSATVLAATATLLVPSRLTAYAAFALLGVGMGATGVVNGTVWARTFGLGEIGRLQGMAMSSMITAAAVAPLIPALSLGITGSYVPALTTLAVVAGLALAISARASDHGR